MAAQEEDILHAAGQKYRLALTPEQGEFAETIGNLCRSVWHTTPEQRREYRRRGRVDPLP